MIDAGNTAVPRVAVPSLEDGLGMIGKGRIAALVGHLRDGTGVIDVDVPRDFGDFLEAEIAGWLRGRGCWVLERPSGGAEGRWHVFFAHKNFHYAAADRRTGLAAEITAYLASLAADVKVPTHELDLRDAIRPLSSPHRHGAVTRPKGDLREALRALRRVLPDRPEPAPLRRRPKIKTTATTPAPTAPNESTPRSGTTVVPLLLQRWKRELRPDWRRYLLTGAIPHGSWSAAATKTRPAAEIDRSLVEAACTRELVWAIGDPQIAWQLVRESHPTAMTKAKHQGWSWWVQYVWNETVRAAAQFNPTPQARRPDAPSADVLAAVTAARADLAALMWSISVRRRTALLLVGHHLLDRVARTGRLRVPCPERDLQLDTGLGDRKTIRSVLRLLNGHIGKLHTDCLSPTERDSTSFEFEINPAFSGGVREIPPPVYDPPRPARGLWATLPRGSHSLWRTLRTTAGPHGLEELVVKAGLVSGLGDEPSRSQLATAKAALVALSGSGMATVDEHGRWYLATRPRSIETDQRAAAAHARQVGTVEAERAAYRTGMTSTWTSGRAGAIRAQRSREKAWWDTLSPAARAERAADKRRGFDQMSLSQQAALKARLAERRARAGLDENENYKTWLSSLHVDEVVARSLTRKERFQTLSAAERGASIEAWNRHRLRYGLIAQSPNVFVNDQSETSVDRHAAVLFDSAAARDVAFLQRQGEFFGAAEGKVAG